MSSWFEDARKRSEQKQQQRNSNLQRVLNDARALEKLEYIRQNIWKCGQIYPYSDYKPDYNSPIPDDSIGFRLHFEYEVLIFNGIPARRNPDTGDLSPGSKQLHRSTQYVEIIIVAAKEGDGPIRLFLHSRWVPGDERVIWTSEQKRIDTVEELDEALFSHCDTTIPAWQLKEKQDRINQEQEEKYRKFDPSKL